jgi:hypothetical protein
MKTKHLHFILPGIIALFMVIFGCNQNTDKYSRGVGIYPGDPAEDFSPVLVTDNSNYRNLARLRSAWHSSSYDYNLTAQLVTDGIVTDKMPDYISLTTNSGVVPKNEREWLFDNNRVTENTFDGNNIWIQLEMNHGSVSTQVTKISLTGSLTYDDKKPVISGCLNQ